ncbi:class I SAM-dependent methyltransferase [Zooshikella harenae]|uniref:Ribosomal RNA small subunit methyltransferase J n=1 Tax=Zooshikella harenae TaxID=2827238 RepID=A0ABS5Z6U6_9GAMM|nr:class I SAM-dependent methyltransferase [Zooshikella harenae]MBU2709724.1 class I SAM-dependent methyltransferase [Zooshikella harenae]
MCSKNTVVVLPATPEGLPYAKELADELNLPLKLHNDEVDLNSALALVVDEDKVSLEALYEKKMGQVYVDFVHGPLAFRRLHGGGKGQAIAKAIGIKKQFKPSVLDVTAGLGRDAFVLAALGCELTLLERSSVVYSLLRDGLRRALKCHEIQSIIERMTLQPLQDAKSFLAECQPESFDCVYLDPMFPHQDKKSALSKKEMQLFRRLLEGDSDADQLFADAYATACYRVVVKRPRVAPLLANKKPTLQLAGKANRFDIYVKKGIPQ